MNLNLLTGIKEWTVTDILVVSESSLASKVFPAMATMPMAYEHMMIRNITVWKKTKIGLLYTGPKKKRNTTRYILLNSKIKEYLTL